MSFKKVFSVLLLVFFAIVTGVVTVQDGMTFSEFMIKMLPVLLPAVILLLVFWLSNPKGTAVDFTPNQDAIHMVNEREWVREFLEKEGYCVDLSLKSLQEIDRFLDEKQCEAEEVSERIKYGLAVYLGDAVVFNLKGEWIFSPDPLEKNLTIKLKDETYVYPMQTLLGRIQSHAPERLYDYVMQLEKEENQ